MLRIWRYPPQSCIMALGLFALAWGAWWAARGSSMFEGNPNFYRFFRLLAPPWFWSAGGIATGVLQWSALSRNSWSGQRRGAMLGVLWWSFVLAAFVLAAPNSTAIPTYGSLVALNLWVFVRLRLLRVARSDYGE